MSFVSGGHERLWAESRIGQFGLAVQEELAAQKERLILWIPVFLAIGIGCYFSLRFEPPFFVGPSATLLAAAVWAAVWPLREAGWRGYSFWLLMGTVTLVFLGFSCAQVRTAHVASPMLETKMAPVDVTGRIVGIDRLEAGQGTQLLLDKLVIERLPADKTPAVIRLKVRQDIDVQVGDRVNVLAGLNPPSAPVEPKAFDFQRYAFFRKLGAFGFTYRAPEIVEHGDVDSFRQKAERLRQTVRLKIEQSLPYPEAAIATALMTGERTAVSEDDWDALRASGLAHMLAISGLHVGLVASVIFLAARTLMAAFPAFALTHPIKKYAAGIALCGALFYMLMVGATIPTLRALLMTGVVLLAIMIDRVPFSLRLVAIAASVVLLFLPESLLGASFQMSFAAVTALIFFYELMRQRISQWYRKAGILRKLSLYFVGVCMTTLVATLATGPLGLFHFQQFAVYSLIANLFAVPLMAFVVMPAAVLSYLLMLCGLETWGLYVAGLGIKGILSIAHGVTDLPHSTLTPAAVPLSALLCFVGAALFCILWKGYGRVLAVIPLIGAVIILSSYRGPDILVSSSGKLVGLRDTAGQLWVSSRRSDRFTAEVWARRYGNDPEALQRWSDNPQITCGEAGCRTLWNGRRFAYSEHASAQAEDCAWADVVISAEPLRVRGCRAQVRIGFFDLWNNGAHAIWADGRVMSVQDARGTRPWTVSNGR